MELLFLDTETTGLEQQDRLIQIGAKFRNAGKKMLSDEAPAKTVSYFFKPPVPINYEAMSVHHITQEMVANEETFEQSVLKSKLEVLAKDGVVVVAHNAKFDLKMLEREGVIFSLYIDTQRVAMHVLDMPRYKLQYLRYALDLRVDGVAHSAEGDVDVLVALFDFLFQKIKRETMFNDSDENILNHMMSLSRNPVLLRRFTFGKHNGKTFEEIAQNDRDYLVWLWNSEMKNNEADRNEDLLYTIKLYLNNNA